MRAWTRRGVLAAAGLAMAAEPAAAQADALLPIVFVHGNGDTAGLWLTIFWRFESNGIGAGRMTAVDLRYPQARNVDAVPQAGRSSAAEVMQQLAEAVAEVRRQTGAPRVILVAQSRGGNTVRNFLKNGGGAAQCALAVLCGAVNHGVIVSEKYLIGSEFNGASPFMRDLNTTPGEVVPGVRFVTLRSDSQDKYAQPDGALLGLPGVPTGVGYDGPALAGATNIVLPGVDHRETGFAPQAFAAMFPFIAGHARLHDDIVAEARPQLDGRVSGFEAGAPTNIPLAGAEVVIWRVDPQTGARLGPVLHRKTTGADGMWGPFLAAPDAFHEFEVSAAGYPVTHLYRSPFPRSSGIVNIRPTVPGAEAQGAASLVYLSRPRGYFGLPRDLVRLDGAVPAGIPAGEPTVALVHAVVAGAQRAVPGQFNAEAITARNWPLTENRVSVIELTY
jgi:pimeloyl-ACP methyl ester carboxylesterase